MPARRSASRSTGRTGWYLRVLREGIVTAGDAMHLLDRPYPDWTIAAANAVMHGREAPRIAIEELAQLPLLSESWRTTLSDRLAKDE